MAKVCTKCKKLKQSTEFYPHKRSADGLQSACNKCCDEASRKWRSMKPEYVKEYRQNYNALNKETVNRRCREYYDKHKIDIAIRVKQYRIDNLERYKQAQKESRIKNIEQIRKTQTAWVRQNPVKIKTYAKKARAKIRNTLQGRLNIQMSTSINKSLREGSKNGRSWESLVGYTAEQLRKYLERKFLPGMTWKNRKEWHIDHIIPIAAFNYETPEDIDFKKCWRLKNLQPIWAKENLSKRTVLKHPFQPSLTMPEKWNALWPRRELKTKPEGGENPPFFH